jgi:hypothetical protein
MGDLMMGEVSNRDERNNSISRGAILRPRKRGRPAVAALSRRLRAPQDVPASGQIVFRSSANQILR